jgi:hypothetical protein
VTRDTTTPATPRKRRLTVWLGWLCIAVGLLAAVFLFLRHGGSSVPKVRWRSHWGQPRWVTFRDPEGLFLIDHPSNWDVSAPFARFTRRPIGELIAVDTVAMRYTKPASLLVIIRYAAPKAMPVDQWLERARPDGPLKDAFGEKILSRQPTRLAGVRALKVVAEGPVVGRPYRLESWFVPARENAYRITIGAPTTTFDQAEPALRKIVNSFRFTPVR